MTAFQGIPAIDARALIDTYDVFFLDAYGVLLHAEGHSPTPVPSWKTSEPQEKGSQC